MADAITSSTNYYVDRFDGGATPGEAFTLSYSPIKIDWVFYRMKNASVRDDPVPLEYNEDAAGTTQCTLGLREQDPDHRVEGRRSPDHELVIAYWAYGPGYNASLEAIEVAEKYDRQGDSESMTVKEKILMVETDTDSHFTTNVSMRGKATQAISVDKENITNMPYNKFKVMEIKAAFAQSADGGWVDWRLWFAKQDDFNTPLDPDTDDMWTYIDIASTMLVSIGSTVEEEGQISNYFFWPPRNILLGGNIGDPGVASFTESGAPIYYEDEDGTNELHLMLENRSDDLAHEAGADKIKIWFKIIPVR